MSASGGRPVVPRGSDRELASPVQARSTARSTRDQGPCSQSSAARLQVQCTGTTRFDPMRPHRWASRVSARMLPMKPRVEHALTKILRTHAKRDKTLTLTRVGKRNPCHSARVRHGACRAHRLLKNGHLTGSACPFASLRARTTGIVMTARALFWQ